MMIRQPPQSNGTTPIEDPPALQPADNSPRACLPLSTLGPIAIIAPHPDDETLGCGGLIALCARLGVPLTVVAMTDGEASHPDSRQISQEQLLAWRADERVQAMAALGARTARVERLGLPDGGMQELSTVARQRCVAQLAHIWVRDDIQTLLVTAHDDEHPDHRASYAFVRLALQHAPPIRTLTYAVWPPPGTIATGERWFLDIGSVQACKHRAIACFASQRGERVPDDPEGFIMPAALLERALAAREIFKSLS